MHESDDNDTVRLVEMLEHYRIPGGLVDVRSDKIVPDVTNRERTGLSVEHVHYIAGKIATHGFKSRRVYDEDGHDIPVLVYEGGILNDVK